MSSTCKALHIEYDRLVKCTNKTQEKYCKQHKNHTIHKEDCAICFEEVDESKEVPLHCGHWFHKQCLNQSHKNICPLCREQMKSDEQRWFMTKPTLFLQENPDMSMRNTIRDARRQYNETTNQLIEQALRQREQNERIRRRNEQQSNIMRSHLEEEQRSINQVIARNTIEGLNIEETRNLMDSLTVDSPRIHRHEMCNILLQIGRRLLSNIVIDLDLHRSQSLIINTPNILLAIPQGEEWIFDSYVQSMTTSYISRFSRELNVNLSNVAVNTEFFRSSRDTDSLISKCFLIMYNMQWNITSMEIDELMMKLFRDHIGTASMFRNLRQ